MGRYQIISVGRVKVVRIMKYVIENTARINWVTCITHRGKFTKENDKQNKEKD